MQRGDSGADNCDTKSANQSAEQHHSSREFIAEILSDSKPAKTATKQPETSDHLAKTGILPQLQIENQSNATTDRTQHKRNQDPSDAKRPSPELVTGNGYGYAMLSAKGELSKFLAHPYAYERAGKDPKDSGVETLNFIESMSWGRREKNPLTTQMRYVNESNIMEVSKPDGKQFHFMPFDLKRNALITINNGETKDLNIKWEHDTKEEQVNINGRKVRVVSFEGANNRLAIVPLDTKTPPQALALLPLEHRQELDKAVQDLLQWQNNVDASKLVERELNNQEKWRQTPNITFQSEDERKLWRQSETILRMGQIKEENNETRRSNGMINASLSGDFVMPYVRDMAYATVAFTQMGHQDEAKQALKSYFDAFPGKMQHETRNQNYQVSLVRYYGDGHEEVDYSEKRKTPNIELDNWGLALWASSEYYRNTRDQAFLNEKTANGNTVYESMRDGVVKPLLANLDEFKDGKIVTKDSSNWEDHQENKKNFAHTTITAIAGLRGFLEMARDQQDSATIQKVEDAIAQLEKGFTRAFIKDGVIRGSLQRSIAHKTDSAVIEAFNLGVVKDPKIIEKTLDKMEELRMSSGGFRRVKGDKEYDKHEFLLIDFNMARLYFKLGKESEGMQILNRIVKNSNGDNGQIPELYVSKKNKEFPGKVGAPAGSIPMIGYGAGAYIMTLRQREEHRAKK